MLILGARDSYLYWRKTGTYPHAMPTNKRWELEKAHALAPLPKPIKNQQAFFEAYVPRIDKATNAALKTAGISADCLETVVYKSTSRRRAYGVHSVQLRRMLPEKSLLSITPDLFICAPWLTLMLLASDFGRCSTPQLLIAGNVLCGRYGQTTSSTAACALVERIPVTSRSNILTALDTFEFMDNRKPRGMKRLREVMSYVCNDARSPMEVASLVLACWKRAWGAYEVDLPKLNKTIVLNNDECCLLHKKTLEGDLVWEDAKLIVEYDGSFHDNDKSIQADSLRQTVLENRGYRVERLTMSVLANVYSFQMFMGKIANALGMSLPCEADFMIRCKALHEFVLSELASGK